MIAGRFFAAAPVTALPCRTAPTLVSDRSPQVQQPNARDEEIQTLRDRLTRLSEASLRVSESLDLDTVLPEVLESARLLTGARYGVITVLDESGQVEHFLGSGLTPEETQGLRDIPGGLKFFEYLSSLPGPLRGGDFAGHARAMGLPEFLPPIPVSSFLTVPIRHRGQGVGNIYLGKSQPGEEFSQEDQGTLVMFASQAALVIANARRHRDERRARADLETLVNTSPVGVVVFDARTGAPLYVNRESRRMLEDLRPPGGELEDLLEVLTFRRADGREVSLEELPLAQAISTGEMVRAEEIVIRAPGGRSVTTLINATPILSEEGVVETVMVTLQDLTPLENLERLRADFLGLVSHELRGPLTSIKGSAVNLRESLNSLDPAEMIQFIRIIESQSDRMRDLIGELLDVARIETGQLSITPEPAEVGALVDEARNAFVTGGGGRNITIDLDPDLPWVMADRRRIVQVLGNLLSNAARYSEEGSSIRLSGALADGYVALTVADEGRGVEPERLPLLFSKFSRSDGDREVLGAGLGLSISKGIVEAHGGRIWAESEGVGKGTTFTFTLPVAEEAVTAATRRSARSRRETGERGRILAVDDDPMTLRTVREVLAKAGYTPLVTGDPYEAIRLFEAEPPRLVLLDLVLPGSDGIELMGRMRSIAPVPVIFLSAYNHDEVIARAIYAGAADYMVKPFSPTELVARVRGALRRDLSAPPVEPSDPFVLGDLTLDYAGREVSVAGRPVRLTPTEYDLLFELSVNAGRVLNFDHLLERVWGLEHSGDRRTVRTYVKRLRRKLGEDGDDPRYIFAEPRVGYRMERPETPGKGEAEP